MVSMVYSDPRYRDSTVARVFRNLQRAGVLFTGPRAFSYWAFAVAYALLPADPSITTAPRRRVRKGASGRWLVLQTTAVRHGPAPIPVPDRRPDTRDLRDFPGTHLPPVA